MLTHLSDASKEGIETRRRRRRQHRPKKGMIFIRVTHIQPSPPD